MNINDFKKYKTDNQKISMITCYDYWSASIIEESDIDTILVGDSVAMISHGCTSTLPATIELMEMHTQWVRRGAPNKFIIADMPFLSHRKSLDSVLDSAGKLMAAGANAIKIEGVRGHQENIKYIVESGIPVIGHLGLTPQSFNSFGGFKLQSKTEEATLQLIEDAKLLEELGCFSIVLECVPDSVGK
ncbi:MAG: 3-methyl-2-oxobutanoate hydroxymethyltransferase, partial [Spirochaetales bacterium]|nr:3-methyl-2-oxobutanoate hydroxymethyltransferase [Spirochaetales bacterium]